MKDSSNDRLQRASGGVQGAGGNLVTGAARNLTTILSFSRDTVTSAVGEAATQAGRVLGALKDTGEDVFTYFDPIPWLEDVYSRLGIASSDIVSEMDVRMDSVELKVDDVARQRAREELMLLQQRIGELESVLGDMNRTEARTVMSNVLGRLSELELRIDALPVIDTTESRRLHT